MPALRETLQDLIHDHSAGDPCREDVQWTYLSGDEIARELAQRNLPVCADTVRSLLREMGFRRRQAEKRKTMGQDPFRNDQFENIADWKAIYAACDNPIISMDTKKKEWLGEFHRCGSAWADGPNETFDHDFSSYASGRLVPHGLYDLRNNRGHLTLGTSHDTSQFAAASFRLWWQRHGRRAWPQARSILLLCDGGGSNNCRHWIFKEDLQRLSTALGLPIRVAHYPPYCSKYNPIEHRLFPHVTRAWSGVVFRGLDLVKRCLKRVWTSTGLTLTHAVINKTFELGRQASDQFLENYPILHDDWLGEWNYIALPGRN
jgi:hypothetical protein